MDKANDLELGMRLIVFLIRAVSFDLKVKKLANKLLKSKTDKQRTINKKELLKLNNTKIISLFNSLPYSSFIKDFFVLIKSNFIEKSGVIGSLYQYNNLKICTYRTISPLQIVDIDNLSYISNLFIEFLNLKSEEYYFASYSYIIFWGVWYIFEIKYSYCQKR